MIRFQKFDRLRVKTDLRNEAVVLDSTSYAAGYVDAAVEAKAQLEAYDRWLAEARKAHLPNCPISLWLTLHREGEAPRECDCAAKREQSHTNMIREINRLNLQIGEPIPLLLHCPSCGERHIDRGEFATRHHHTHACQTCGMVWRPAIVATVGVEFLPGFRDTDP